MPRASLRHGVDIEFDTFGNPENPAMLWIMGFTAQMIAWPEEFLQQYADEGFFVIRFDNRDCGLSTSSTASQSTPMRSLRQRSWRPRCLRCHTRCATWL